MDLKDTTWAVPCYDNGANGSNAYPYSLAWWIITLEPKSGNVKVTSKWNNMQLKNNTADLYIDDMIGAARSGATPPFVGWEVSGAGFGSGVPKIASVPGEKGYLEDYIKYYFNQQANCIYEFNTIMTPVFNDLTVDGGEQQSLYGDPIAKYKASSSSPSYDRCRNIILPRGLDLL